jgi:hypothetical protein
MRPPWSGWSRSSAETPIHAQLHNGTYRRYTDGNATIPDDTSYNHPHCRPMLSGSRTRTAYPLKPRVVRRRPFHAAVDSNIA